MLRRAFVAVAACMMICAATAATADESAAPPSAKPLLLAHYMPWFSVSRSADDPKSTTWGWHWTMNHFDPHEVNGDRRAIASHFYPLIGPYDSSDPAVIRYHLLLMKTAGIDGVIVDWYGLEDFNDYAMLHRNTQTLFESVSAMGMRFAICYEDQTIPFLVKAGRLAESQQVQHAIGEINHIAATWFEDPCYVRVDGRPLLLSFGDSGLTDEGWRECLSGLRSPVAYFSEHTRRDGAVGAYDWPVPSMGFAATERFQSLAKEWKHAIPVAFPRFVDIYADAKVSEGYVRIDDWGGETFKRMLVTANTFDAPSIQIATWNDWGEGTQVEPSREYGFRDLELLQKFRQRAIDPGFPAKAADLRLPWLLWKMQQNEAADAEQIASIAELIFEARFEEARVQLQTTK
ncbi:glycoside hydrolase family 71/99-like protein [Aporhodopirellula aestuarii]|uniref:Glycoside hydrolase family 71/99-like protein n=1 Tax=Aporhodopirellula aestuarii TaxID=2950107 RepID=A0ABT0UC00_9BACT|nr:glycoside hydrolase family 71/99-like protein [Aporhodopirellula aestuarii]MCM2374547.1 glycoside hydrolase family 71/99-like protein [Aporhodopirellula aestuarii]